MNQTFIHWPLRKALLVASGIWVQKNQEELNEKPYFSSLVPQGTDGTRLTVALISNRRSCCMCAVFCLSHALIDQSDTLCGVEISFWIRANTSRCSGIYCSYCNTSQYLGNMDSSGCSCEMPVLVCSKARALLCVTELATLCVSPPRGSCLKWEKCNCSGQNSPFGPQRWKRYRSCFRQGWMFQKRRVLVYWKKKLLKYEQNSKFKAAAIRESLYVLKVVYSFP